jgi:hypothetical protein
MTGISQTGAQRAVASLVGAVVPVYGSTAPANPVPGQYWVNTSGIVQEFNGSAWVTAGNYYLALCTADPSNATTIAGIQEVTTSGYSRVQVQWNPATATLPAVISNTSLIQFGPMTANMTLASQWVALVSVASGTTGFLLYTWTLSKPQQVVATQYVAIPASDLTINQS